MKRKREEQEEKGHISNGKDDNRGTKKIKKNSSDAATAAAVAKAIDLDDMNDEASVRLVISSKELTQTKDKPRTIEELANSNRDFTEEDYEALLKLDESNKPKSFLTAKELEAIPRKYLNRCDILGIKRRKTNETCCICCNRFVNGDYVRVLPGCGHIFHTFCIDPWLSTSTLCPVDRKDLREEIKEAKAKAQREQDELARKKECEAKKVIEIIEID